MTDICEIPEFYTTSEPVARREYPCVECRATIRKGEKHVHCRGKWDGKISAYRQHLLCCEACELIRDHFNGGECIPFGGLMSEFGELRTNGYPRGGHWKRLRGLMARILVRERREEQS